MGTCALSIESETTHIGTNNIAATSQSCQSQTIHSSLPFYRGRSSRMPPALPDGQSFPPPPSLGRQCRSQAWLLQLEDPFGVSTSEIQRFVVLFAEPVDSQDFKRVPTKPPQKPPNMFFSSRYVCSVCSWWFQPPEKYAGH